MWSVKEGVVGLSYGMVSVSGGSVSLVNVSFEPVSVVSLHLPLVSATSLASKVELEGVDLSNVVVESGVFGVVVVDTGSCVLTMTHCMFDGETPQAVMRGNDVISDVCGWSGSLVRVSRCTCTLTNTSITNSSNGALMVGDGANVRIVDGLFENNNPQIPDYLSVRRNVLCSSSTLNVESVKGGDGAVPNTSLWIRSTLCTLNGLAQTYPSSFFIPTLTNVAHIPSASESGKSDVTLTGTLLLPCNTSLVVSITDTR
jgi:hypothetical protein